jgi:hypothetical protein
MTPRPDQPPGGPLMQMLMGPFVAQAVYVAAELGLADRLADGPRPARQLAQECGVDPDALHRVLRCLAAVGVFVEVDRDTYGPNELGGLLREGAPGGLRNTALVFGGETFRAFGEIMHSVRTGRPAFEKVFGEPFYDHIARDERLNRRFDQVVAETNRPVGELLRRADLGGATCVADLGGRHGALLAELLTAHPHLRGILYDLPETVAEAAKHLAAAGVVDRCDIVAGDFFRAVPADADVYVLARCLHNWGDDDALRILRSVRAAMADGDRLLVVERILPGDGAYSLGKVFDLVMLVALGGRERTAEEYQSLLARAGLRVSDMSAGPGGTTLIDATPSTGDGHLHP